MTNNQNGFGEQEEDVSHAGEEPQTHAVGLREDSVTRSASSSCPKCQQIEKQAIGYTAYHESNLHKHFVELHAQISLHFEQRKIDAEEIRKLRAEIELLKSSPKKVNAAWMNMNNEVVRLRAELDKVVGRKT